MKKRNFYQLAHYGVIQGNPKSREFCGIACDSRLVKPGNIFVALKGAKTDGHLYLKEAAEKGAVGAIVEDGYKGPHFGMAFLHVVSPFDTLQQLARDILAHQQSKVIAITGSLGKTTIKEFLYTLLKGKYRVMKTPGNANSQVGLPLALINALTGHEEYIVCEMGMTHKGDIARLVKIAPPFLSIISCVEAVHVCNFSGIEEIVEAKSEIFSHHSTAMALIDLRVPLKESNSINFLTFSKNNEKADFIFSLDSVGALGIFGLKENKEIAHFSPLQLPGKHNAFNFLIAATAAHLLGMSWNEIAVRQPLLQLPEKRLQFVEKKGVLYINDSYNASLVSVKAALDSLPEPQPKGRKYAALGEMLELGTFTEPHHRAVGEHALSILDGIFCLGEGCKPILDVWKEKHKPCHLFMERDQLISALREIIKPGDVVLVKGSRLKEMWKVIDEI